MTDEKLLAAIHEAKRFIAKATEARKALIADDLKRITGCKETGAARRASLDLTRALAELRKS